MDVRGQKRPAVRLTEDEIPLAVREDIDAMQVTLTGNRREIHALAAKVQQLESSFEHVKARAFDIERLVDHAASRADEADKQYRATIATSREETLQREMSYADGLRDMRKEGMHQVREAMREITSLKDRIAECETSFACRPEIKHAEPQRVMNDLVGFLKRSGELESSMMECSANVQELQNNYMDLRQRFVQHESSQPQPTTASPGRQKQNLDDIVELRARLERCEVHSRDTVREEDLKPFRDALLEIAELRRLQGELVATASGCGCTTTENAVWGYSGSPRCIPDRFVTPRQSCKNMFAPCARQRSEPPGINAMESRLICVEQTLRDTVDSGRLPELKSIILSVQRQLVAVERSVCEKVNSADLIEIRDSIGELQVRVADFVYGPPRKHG